MSVKRKKKVKNEKENNKINISDINLAGFGFGENVNYKIDKKLNHE